MCARYILERLPATWAGLVGAVPDPSGDPAVLEGAPGVVRPTDRVPAVAWSQRRQAMVVTPMRWGLVGHRSQGPQGRPPLINARSESAGEKPTFAPLVGRRHALLAAEAFVEWTPSPGRQKRQGWRIHQPPHPVFFFAALWDVWSAPDGPPLVSTALLTADASPLLQPLHDRMPVALTPADAAHWVRQPQEGWTGAESLAWLASRRLGEGWAWEALPG